MDTMLIEPYLDKLDKTILFSYAGNRMRRDEKSYCFASSWKEASDYCAAPLFVSYLSEKTNDLYCALIKIDESFSYKWNEDVNAVKSKLLSLEDNVKTQISRININKAGHQNIFNVIHWLYMSWAIERYYMRELAGRIPDDMSECFSHYDYLIAHVFAGYFPCGWKVKDGSNEFVPEYFPDNWREIWPTGLLIIY